MSRRTAIGRAWGKPVPFAAVQSVREAAHVVSQNNGQIVYFRGTVRSGGAWGWAKVHFDSVTNKWSNPVVLPELTGVTHLCLDHVTGSMFETHFRNGKLTLFKRDRVVSRLVVRDEPPVSGLVINLSLGWDPVVAQHKIDQGRSFGLVCHPWNAGHTHALWAVSPKLGTQGLLLPAIQNAFMLDTAMHLILARTGPSTNGLAELSLSIPKNPVLGGMNLYFQSVTYNPRTGRGAFTDLAGIEIGK